MDIIGEQGEVVGGLYPAPDRYLLGPHYNHPRGECTWKCTGPQLFRLQEPSHRDPLEEAASAAESSVAELIYREYAKRIGHENAISALGDTAWMLPWFRAENTRKKVRLKRKARMKAALPPRNYLNRQRAELDGSGADANGGAGVDSDDLDRVPDAEALSDRAARWSAASGPELAIMIAEVELASLDDAETIEYLKAASRLAAWTESRRIGAMHRFTEHRPNMGDESGNSEVFSRYAGGEISAALSISPGSGRHQLGQSWFIYKHLPASYTALSDGRISLAHARMIMRNCPPANADDTAQYEHELLDLCEGLSPAQLDKQAMRVSNDINPTSLEERHQTVRKSRNVNFKPQPDAMMEIYAYLPAVEAAAIEDHLERTARSLQAPDEFRNHTQLKADVFTDLLLGKHTANGPRPRAKVLVTIPALTLMGHSDQPGDLEGYGPVPADVARRLAGESNSWYRILTDPFTGSVLAYGRKHKKPPADLKRLLRARDGHCRFPGCNRKPVGCDIDHTKAREDGGLTDHDNCAHLCKAHHKAKHEGGWKLEQLRAGILSWTAPTGHVYKTRPDYTSKPVAPIEPVEPVEPDNVPPPF